MFHLKLVLFVIFCTNVLVLVELIDQIFHRTRIELLFCLLFENFK